MPLCILFTLSLSVMWLLLTHIHLSNWARARGRCAPMSSRWVAKCCTRPFWSIHFARAVCMCVVLLFFNWVHTVSRGSIKRNNFLQFRFGICCVCTWMARVCLWHHQWVLNTCLNIISNYECDWHKHVTIRRNRKLRFHSSSSSYSQKKCFFCSSYFAPINAKEKKHSAII